MVGPALEVVAVAGPAGEVEDVLIADCQSGAGSRDAVAAIEQLSR